MEAFTFLYLFQEFIISPTRIQTVVSQGDQQLNPVKTIYRMESK